VHHQAFGFQLAQRFSHRNAAGVEALGQGVLAQLLASLQFTAEDVMAQGLSDVVVQRPGR
jgi:hypothetical protein